MSFILNIDTSTEVASVFLTEGGNIVFSEINEVQKEHASFVHMAIQNVLNASNKSVHDLKAVAVSCGPGSYTGIRVGMATAKGLCYSLNIPLIMINTLEILALAATLKTKEKHFYYAPMIDARRMEVYTGLYDHEGKEITKPAALILNQESFSKILEDKQVVFCGSGIKKLQEILKHVNAIFVVEPDQQSAMAKLSDKHYSENDFADLVSSEPLYLKDLYEG